MFQVLTRLCEICLLATIFVVSWITSDDVNRNLLVKTTCGFVEGFEKDGAYSFRGIPYAFAPVGMLRWKPPVPLKSNCWAGVFKAHTFGNPCVHRDMSGKEDCLYLNVWTPGITLSTPLPVMVWVHGGSLQFGSGNDESYCPTEKLARETNVVYVSMNYRLQNFGFMALQILSEESPTNTSGNYGFMDIIEVLRWVQANIANFGGDPGQVTLFGQSSGGTAVFALLGSPLCRGLFHRAWLSSASPILNMSAQQAFKDNEVFLNNLPCQNLTCMRSLSAEEVTKAVPWYEYPSWAMVGQIDLPTKGGFYGALAVVDGYVLEDPPFESWIKGTGVDVPLLVGTTAQEVDFMPRPSTINSWSWADYKQKVRSSLGSFGDLVAGMALKMYPSGQKDPRFQFQNMASDVRANCGNDYLSLMAAQSFNSSVYRYVLTGKASTPVYRHGSSVPSIHSFHALDLIAYFGYLRDLTNTTNVLDTQLQDNIRSEVLSFVKNGKPSSKGWDTFPDKTALLSQTSDVIASSYHKNECLFWLTNGMFSYSWIN